MSEQSTIPDEIQGAGAEFDAEAAQKARVVLEGGASVGGDGVIRQDELAPGDGSGPILDEDKKILRDVAGNFYRNHEDIEDTKGTYQERVDRQTKKLNDLHDIADPVVRKAEGAFLNDAEKQKLEDTRDDIFDLGTAKMVDSKYLDEASTKSSANLWNSQQHLKQNRAGYETAAIEDANAAGHEINWDTRLTDARNAQEQPQTETEQPPQGAA